MTELQQRIAIARLAGWSEEQIATSLEVLNLETEFRKLPRKDSFSAIEIADKIDSIRLSDSYIGIIPDYPNDLNAMHGAETCEALIKVGFHRYIECLAIACGTERVGALIFSTAAQRAEAFLRACDLWED